MRKHTEVFYRRKTNDLSKRHLVFVLGITLLMTHHLESQQIVFDPAVLTALTRNHSIENANLVKIKKSITTTAGAQTTATATLTSLAALEQKFQEAMTTAAPIIHSMNQIQEARSVLKSIGDYTVEILHEAAKNPIYNQDIKNSALSVKKEANLIWLKIASMVTASKNSQPMTFKDRLDLLNLIVEDLYTLRMKLIYMKYAIQWAHWTDWIHSDQKRLYREAMDVFKNGIKASSW
ncbi:MAG: hypothetical protein OXC92_06400 [Flavobacteriaceae bacterium]|nr:hypothetical protein [Flavobacteriaceae bacterium]MCY4216595.1 hypothetical protein [Flavobacteriaceae bacterium]MCY4253502.1 hypothetical protein [Flavobacteriaceae bacterium]